MPTLLESPIRLEVDVLTLPPDEQERADQFAAWLRERMTERGVGVNQLGEYADVAPSLVSRYMRAKQLPSSKNAVKLAEYFRRPVREVLMLAGHPTGDPEPVEDIEVMAADIKAMNPAQRKILKDIARMLADQNQREKRERGEA